MKLKTLEIEGKTYAEVSDGKPIYVGDDGKETAFDAPHTAGTIARVQSEAKAHREAKEKAESALKAFEGISDPTAAVKALDTVANLDDKKLVDAGEVERVKEAAIKAATDQFKPTIDDLQSKLDEANTALHEEKIGGSFSRSAFVKDEMIIPADLVQSQFGKHFSIVEGAMVAKDSNGNEIYSKERPGERANFDEALSIIVDGYSHKDSILKGDQANGSAADQNSGAKPNGSADLRTVSGGREDRAAALAAKFPGLPLS